MDIFTRFNRNRIHDRQIDTLIGLTKGIMADGKVNHAEADFLLGWLAQNQFTESPVILNLYQKVSSMLEDGILDDEESNELLSLLRRLSGDSSEFGEVAKATTLPVDDPAPEISFDGTTFLYTGTFAYGTRKQCHAVTESLGGRNAKGVTKEVNFLVLGTYVTESWAHEAYGRKIEKAMAYREAGVPIAIVTEGSWVDSAGL